MLELKRETTDRILFESLRAIYQFELAKETSFGLSYEDIYLLQFLRSKSPSKMSEIAREMGMPISTATRVIDRLQKKDLLSREKDPEDKRNILVFLKPGGEKIVKRVEDHTFEIISGNLKGFSKTDVDAFIKTASSLQQILKVPSGEEE